MWRPSVRFTMQVLFHLAAAILAILLLFAVAHGITAFGIDLCDPAAPQEVCK